MHSTTFCTLRKTRLRHLYSSILAESGASVKFAQQRLGHADAGTTMNIYTHLLTDEGREYAEKVEEAFQFSSVGLTLAKTEAASLEMVAGVRFELTTFGL